MKATPLFPNVKERYWGWRYLLFQMIFLAMLLQMILSLMGIPLSAAGINILYFCLNAAVTVVGFWDFWRRTFLAARRSFPRILLTAAAGLLTYRVLAVLTAVLIVLIDPGFANVNDQNISVLTQEHFWVMTIGTVILVPIAEEVLNRGVVFGSLFPRSPVAAYAVSAIVFSIIHINGYIGSVPPLTLFLCFLQYLPAGICLAAAYHISGSILTPILIHSAVNAIAIFSMR